MGERATILDLLERTRNIFAYLCSGSDRGPGHSITARRNSCPCRRPWNCPSLTLCLPARRFGSPLGIQRTGGEASLLPS